jgi:hypothetical protein
MYSSILRPSNIPIKYIFLVKTQKMNKGFERIAYFAIGILCAMRVLTWKTIKGEWEV